MGESVIKQYKDIEDYDLIFGGWHASVIDHGEPAIFHEANPSIAEAFLEDCNNEIEKAIENANQEATRLERTDNASNYFQSRSKSRITRLHAFRCC